MTNSAQYGLYYLPDFDRFINFVIHQKIIFLEHHISLYNKIWQLWVDIELSDWNWRLKIGLIVVDTLNIKLRHQSRIVDYFGGYLNIQLDVVTWHLRTSPFENENLAKLKDASIKKEFTLLFNSRTLNCSAFYHIVWMR